MASPQVVADLTLQLATQIDVGGTTATLQSNVDDDGVTLQNGLYYFTLNNGTSIKEHISCTKTGTSLTAIKTVSRQGVETSGVLRRHRVGASVIMTDFATYKAYIDGIALQGAVDSSISAKGIVKMSVAPVLADSPIAVGDNDPRLTLDTTLPGIISPYGGSTAPTGWLLCDGSAINRTTYAALFAITSTSYGVGNGTTTFNVPDLRGRVAVGKSTDTEFDVLGETGGEKTHILTTTEMPSHNHPLEILGGNVGTPVNQPLSGSGNTYTNFGYADATGTVRVGFSGGGTAHNNLQPYQVVNYIIKT